MFQSLTLRLYKPITSPSMPTTTATVLPITFEDIAAAFSEEANRQQGQQKLAHPESEYANVASAPSVEQKVNPMDDIRIHRQNPKGVSCDNPICNRLPRSMTHDWEHCMQSGGEMESKAPWTQQRGKREGKKKDTATSATETKSSTTISTSTSTSTPSETTALAFAPSHNQDWSCTLIEELDPSCVPTIEDMACIANQTLSTILDSGTTSTLITNKEFF